MSGFPAWLKWMLISAGLVSFVAVSSLAFLVAGAMSDSFLTMPINPISGGDSADIRGGTSSINDPIKVQREAALPTPLPADEAAEIPTTQPITILQDYERTTVLVMGLDRRPGENYPTRTDTMILLSIDPDTDSASMLSVPRDLYVDIPGYYRDRINVAYVLGALNGGNEATGAQLAMDTVERNLGVQVDHYLLVDFNAVTSLIDAVGGLTVNVEQTIDDPLYPNMNYGYDPLYIPAGEQTLDGATTLKYMRTRHGDNDFERSRRQQNAMLALQSKLVSLGPLGLAQRGPVIWQQIQDGIFTDLSLNDVLGLMNAGIGLSAESINSGVIDYNYAYSYQTSGGASVLILRTEEVASLIAELFN